MTSKPFLLFATPRSGSTPIYHLLAAYLFQHFKIIGINEFFNPRGAVKIDSQGITVGWSEIPINLNASRYDDELVLRMKALKTWYGQYFLKVFPGPFKPDQLDWLRANFEWIYLERRSVFEQALSFLISAETDLWYQKEGIRLPSQSLIARKDAFEVFENLILTYQSQRKINKANKIIYYEDYIDLGSQNLLTALGFDKPLDLASVKITAVQNKNQKSQIFQNYDEITKWYMDSYLQSLAPI